MRPTICFNKKYAHCLATRILTCCIECIFFIVQQLITLTPPIVAVKVHEKATELHAIASLTVMMNNENHNTIDHENQNGGRQVAPVSTGSTDQATNGTVPSVSNGKIHNSEGGDSATKGSQLTFAHNAMEQETSARRQPEVITVAIPTRGSGHQEELQQTQDENGPAANGNQIQVGVRCQEAALNYIK